MCIRMRIHMHVATLIILHLIQTFRDCYVSDDDAQTLKSFVKAARSHDFHINCAHISQSLWSMYIFKLSQDFLQSCNSSSSMKTMVSCLGRQPNSDVWVFGPEVQMDLTGRIIPPEELRFFW